MNKIYLYAALLANYGFLFKTLKNSNYLLASLVIVAILIISSKLYKFQEGKELKSTYQKLPIVKFSAFVFMDKGILTSQNLTSLSVFMLSAVFSLSMVISFYLFGETIRHLLLFSGCVSFSLIFTKVFLNSYVQEGE